MHREKVLTQGREYAQRYRQINKQRIRENQRTFRAANRGFWNAQSKEWDAKNPDKCAAYSKARKLAKIQRLPEWADKAAVTAIYKDAIERTRITGIEHHVDHIVPLRSKFVSGLHWELNLQVIPASENRKKRNSYWPGMW